MISAETTDHPPPLSATHFERKWKPHLGTAPNCPRCAAANTKFCYYNNYSLSQPRYFCKSCRRYWTNGGSLRNLPVGRRKSRRSKSSAAVPPPTKPHVSTQILTESDSSSEIDLAAVFARFLNSDPQTLTISPESADALDNPTTENSEIFFEGISDLLLDEEVDKKQGITEDYEIFPFGLQPQFGVEELFPSQQIQEFDSFSCNDNANHFRVSDQFYPVGDNWVNNIDFF